MKFNPTPAFAICGIVTVPDPKMMAFGGVATGSIKAQDAEMAAGTTNKNGWIFIANAVTAKIGIKMVEVAVFEVTSVKKVSIKHVIIIIMSSGTVEKKLRLFPIHSAKPLDLNPIAKAIPPPNKIKIPHGIRIAHSQFNRNSFFLKFTGIKKSKMDAKIATVASLTNS